MSYAALSAASLIPVFAHRWGHFRQRVSVLVYHVATSWGCHIRAAMAESDDLNKLLVAPGVLKETVLKVVPKSVRHFPWEKAEGVLINKAIFIGQKALKWVLVAFLVTSSVLDFLFDISWSRELLAPLGLLMGCLLTDFLKEVAMKYSENSRDASLLRYLVAIICFFTVLVGFCILCPESKSFPSPCCERRIHADHVVVENHNKPNKARRHCRNAACMNVVF